MVNFSFALFGLSTLAGVLAGPVPMPMPTAAPDLNKAIAKRATTCTFSGSTGASLASKSKTSCSTIILSAIAVPSGVTLDLTGLNSGTHVIMQGTTTFGYEEWSGPLFAISGTNIVMTSASGAYFKGDGARWWDTLGSNGGKTKPKFFQAHDLITSSITGVYIQNPPVQVFSINGCTTLALNSITIDGSAGDTDALGHNTDGFDIGSSTGVTITGANVYNQDDCVAVNSGTNIVFTSGTCSGGHGLSIGSVGGRTDNVVNTVTFSSSTIKASANGIRIKTNSGTTGSITGVTYKDIILTGITEYGITVRQDYNGVSGTPTNGVTIKNFVLSNIVGTVTSAGTDIYIVCGSGSCSSWTWSGINVTGGKTSSSCQNLPSGISC